MTKRDDKNWSHVFEERAEHLPKDNLMNWSISADKEDKIVEKLKGLGLKLLSGPRGSGKSTLLLRAYYEMLDDGEIIPAYVNFSRSISLEPLFRTKSNAYGIFRQWVIGKIILAINSVIEEKGIEISSTIWPVYIEFYESFINDLDKGIVNDNFENALSVDQLVDTLDSACLTLHKKRIVLLLDDAAHAFSIEQQRDFFEVFSALKSNRLSAKAAVYPGITSYSPTFHIGHDAELINAWYSPEDKDYLNIMRQILERRLPEDIFSLFEGKQSLVDLVALASFGIPRAFLNMISKLLNFGESGKPKIDRGSALTAIREQDELSMKVFMSIKSRMTRYSGFVETGEAMFGSMVERISHGNANQDWRTVSLALQAKLPKNIERVLGLMEYSGIIRSKGDVSRGEVGKFTRYTIHYATLIAKNALGLGRSYSVDQAVATLVNRAGSRYPVSTLSSLLSENQVRSCVLKLPDCGKCGTPRMSDEQKFCMNCGAELSNPSLYREMLDASVDKLPLTKNKIDKLNESGLFSSIADLLIDDEQKLRSIHGIGPYWSRRIKTAAEEFVSV